MRIAIPVHEGRLALHFGHCSQFKLVDVDTQSKSISGIEEVAAPDHQPGLLPRWLASKDVNVVLAGGMGVRAQKLFAENGIQVMVGAPDADPAALVVRYLDGSLECGANVCDH